MYIVKLECLGKDVVTDITCKGHAIYAEIIETRCATVCTWCKKRALTTLLLLLLVLVIHILHWLKFLRGTVGVCELWQSDNCHSQSAYAMKEGQ